MVLDLAQPLVTRPTRTSKVVTRISVCTMTGRPYARSMTISDFRPHLRLSLDRRFLQLSSTLHIAYHISQFVFPASFSSVVFFPFFSFFFFFPVLEYRTIAKVTRLSAANSEGSSSATSHGLLLFSCDTAGELDQNFELLGKQMKQMKRMRFHCRSGFGCGPKKKRSRRSVRVSFGSA